MSLHEKWENIDHRLRMLDAADQDGEAGLLSDCLLYTSPSPRDCS